MRLRSVFKMRMSILNVATTEQMGYIIFFFFRLHQIYKSVSIGIMVLSNIYRRYLEGVLR